MSKFPANAAGESPNFEIPWYVIQTCCHHEVRVEERLQKMDLEIFLPRLMQPSRRRDRKKILQTPLFPGYLFVQDALEANTYLGIIKVPGVVRILYGSHRLQSVPQGTIESIKLTLASDRPFYPHRYLKRGKHVRVTEGPLSGLVGKIMDAKEKRRKVVIEVELFQRAIAVELEDELVEPWC